MKRVLAPAMLLLASIPFAVSAAAKDDLGTLVSGELRKLTADGVIEGLVSGRVRPAVDPAALAHGLRVFGLRPYAENGWARGLRLPDLSRFEVSPRRLAEILSVARESVKIALAVSRREAAHARQLARKGIAEEGASRAACRFALTIDGQVLLFDQWGELFIDRRFVTPEELPVVKRMERLYREVFPKPLKADSRTALVRTTRTAPGTGKLPIFRGFEDAHYQRHDALIRRLTAEFNAGKAVWCGGTAVQAAGMRDLSPILVKSHMIEESGGRGARSVAAWQVDPLQVNVPGDWGPEKRLLGLVKPTRRNEGTVERNVKAAIMYLSRKGFGTSGLPAARRPKGFFDGWPVALQRYNARRDRTETGRCYSEDYADKIVRRAADPDLFVPIEIRLAAPRQKTADRSGVCP